MLAGLYEELRTLIGPGGYHALLVRALALASKDHPVLRRVGAERGSLPSLSGLPQGSGTADSAQAEDALLTLTAELLELLCRNIGVELTHTLLHRGWPEAIEAPSDR